MGNARHAGPHVPALAELGVPDAEIASVQVPYAAFNVVGESWTYFYGLGVVLEVILLALILRYAWTWPRTAPSATMATSPDRETVRAQQQA